MKKHLLLFVAALLLCFNIYAQPPRGFKFQAVARDNSGILMTQKTLTVRVGILTGGDIGPTEYVELHTVTTNEYGLFSLNVGEGTPTFGDYEEIQWGTGRHFLRIEMDVNGGNNYVKVGTSEILAVPYARYAETVADKDDADADPTNELQAITISNDTIYLSNGGFVKLPAGFSGNYGDLSDAPTKLSDFTNDQGYLQYELDGSTKNEIQSLSISNDTVFLSDGGFVKLPAGFDGDFGSLTNVPTNLDTDATDDFSGNYNDLTNRPTDVSTFNNDAGYLTSFTEVDGSTTNEIQVLSISNDTIHLSNGGFVKLPAGFDGDFNSLTSVPANLDTDATDDFSGNYNDLTNRPTNVSTFTNDAGYLTSFTEVDGSTTNEIQAISISNDTVFLSDGGFVKLPAGFDGDFNSLTSVPANLDTDATDDFSGNYNDLTNRPTNVSTFTNDAGYLTSFTEVDGSLTNEIQALSISNDTIHLSNGGFVKLPAGFDGDFNSLTSVPANLDTDATDDFSGNYNDLTNRPTNVSTFNNDVGYLTSFTEVDGSTTNEIQAISISNDTVFLSDGGFVKLPAGFDGDFNSLTSVPANLDTDATDDFSGNYNDLTNRPTNVSTFTNDAGYLTSFTEVDGSTTNEIQALSISNDTVYLSDGGFVKLPAGFSGNYADLNGAPTNVSSFTNDANYVASGSISNSDVNSSAAIAFSKLNITKADIEGLGIPGSDENTTYTAGDGLNLNAETFSVADGGITTDKLTDGAVTGTKIAQNGASTGQTLKWNGSEWVPADDENDDTTYYPGTGLNLNGTEFSIDATVVTSNYDGVVLAPAFVSKAAQGTAPFGTNSTTKVDNLNADLLDGLDSSDFIVKDSSQGATAGQALIWSGTEWAPADVTATDAQTLSISNDTLSIQNGNFVVLPSSGADADADSTNELQTLSVSNDSISISNGNTVKVPDELPAATMVLSETETNTGLNDAGYSLAGRASFPMEEYTIITQPESWSNLSSTGAPTGMYWDPMMGDYAGVMFYNSKVYAKSYNGTVYIYDPSTDSWSNAATKPTSLYGAAIWTGSKWLMVYGNNTYAYLPDTDSWETLTSPPAYISSSTPPGIWSGTEIYYIYGNNVYAYNPTTNSWATKAAPPAYISSSSTITWTGTKIVTVYGTNSYSYDPASNSWTTLSSPPSGIYSGAKSFASGNSVYYLYSDKFYAYNYETDSWTTKTNPFSGSFYGTTVWSGSEFIAIKSDLVTKSYNPSTDSWTNLTSPSSGSYSSGVSCYGDNTAYFFYGSSTRSKYTPALNSQGFTSSSATYLYFFRKD